MSRTLTASDRKALIKLASTLPKGSDERKAILAMDVILDVSSASRTVADIEKATRKRVAGKWDATPRDPLDLTVMLALSKAFDKARMRVSEADSMNITLDKEEVIVSVRVGTKVGIVVYEFGSDDPIYSKDYSWNVPAGKIVSDVYLAAVGF